MPPAGAGALAVAAGAPPWAENGSASMPIIPNDGLSASDLAAVPHPPSFPAPFPIAPWGGGGAEPRARANRATPSSSGPGFATADALGADGCALSAAGTEAFAGSCLAVASHPLARANAAIETSTQATVPARPCAGKPFVDTMFGSLRELRRTRPRLPFALGSDVRCPRKGSRPEQKLPELPLRTAGILAGRG